MIDTHNTPSLRGTYGRRGRPPKSAYAQAATVQAAATHVELSDDEILTDINNRFRALEDVAKGVVDGHYRAVIVSGNPGIGKTFTLEQKLKEAFAAKKIRYTSVSGFARATGLFRLLYECKDAGSVLLIDDCDSVFGDETALNLLKKALDTTDERMVSWYSERPFKDEEGEALPKSFQFDGTIVFVTNMDFDRQMESKLGTHLAALISRTIYLDLNLRSQRHILARLTNVVRSSNMLADLGLTARDGEFLIDYITTNLKRLREVSLRTVVKLATIRKASASDAEFQRVASMACCRPA